MGLRGIPNRLWPVHPELPEGELLSSWMVRTAHSNGYQVETMCSMLFGTRSAVWNRDIDRSVTPWMVHRLAQFGGRDPEAVENATLRSLVGTISENVQEHGASTGIVPLGVYHRTRRRNGLMFCAVCLGRDAVPHFRKAWRLSYITACAEHGCQLLDACPSCGAELAPHRVDMRWPPRASNLVPLQILCHRCLACLAETQPVEASEEEMRIAMDVASALQRGWVNVTSDGSKQWVHSIAYFMGLQALVRGLHQIAARSGATWASAKGSSRAVRWQGLDRQDLHGRRKRLEEVGLLLDEWPRKFLKLAKDKNLTYTDLTSSRMQLPMWVDRVARTELLRAQNPVNAAQQEAIACATLQVEGRFNVSRARRLSGCSLDRARLGEHWFPSVGRDVFSTFLLRLDGAIAEASGMSRLLRMQDRVMFVYAWTFGLTQVDLSSLTLTSVATFIDPPHRRRDQPIIEALKDRARAIAEMIWYLRELRPQLGASANEKAVFVSPFTRAPLSASAIGERFRQLRVFMAMEREILNYGAFISKGVISRDSMR